MFPSLPTTGTLFVAPFHNSNIVQDASVTANDVLLGRGASADRFDGNVKFRALVRQHKGAYQAAAPHPHDKALIARQVVDTVHANRGRFLRRIKSSSSNVGVAASAAVGDDLKSVAWEVVEYAVALEKVKQAMRDIQQRNAKKASKRPPVVLSTNSSSDVLGTSSSKRPNTTRAVESSKKTKPGYSYTGKKQPDSAHAVTAMTVHAAMATTPYQTLAVKTHVGHTPHSVGAAQETTHFTMSRHLQEYLERSIQLPSAAIAPPVRHVNSTVSTTLSTSAVLGSNLLLPSMSLLNERIRNQVAFSYLDCLPLVHDAGRMLPFTSQDWQILLLTRAWAETARDVYCLDLIRTVMIAVLNLPPTRVCLSSDEMECMIRATRDS